MSIFISEKRLLFNKNYVMIITHFCLISKQIYSMLNPQQNFKELPSRFENLKALQAYKQSIITLQSTLIKPIQSRHHNDHVNIQTFLSLSPFFTELQLHFSPQFAKNIIKRSRIYSINGKRRIYEEGERMSKVVMPLYGSFFVRNSFNQQKQESKTIFEIFQKGIDDVQSNIPFKKKSTSMQRRMSLQLQSQQTKTYPANFRQLDRLVPFNHEQPLFLSNLQEQKYAQSLYTNGETFILTITHYSLRTCFFEEYQYNLQQKCQLFRKIECFKILDNQQLKLFIEQIQFTQLKKDEYVFRQGEESKNLYILVQGQAKATRTVQLFKQDPNALYRVSCKSQAGRKIQKMPQFSYADFEGVYNYSPQKKKMQLGIIAPITIFGEQQIISGIQREADVQITSTIAKMYVFTLADIEAVGNGKKIQVDAFTRDLFNSITSRRIVARRENLSVNLQFQNRRKMNYFFIQNPDKNHLQKRGKTAKQRINRSLSPAVPKRPASSVKPRYHNFNFNQFLASQKKPSLQKLSRQQLKVAALSHNTGQIQGKIDVFYKYSRQQQSYKHNINIASPLFDVNYYKRQRRQMLRIQNKKRMRMIEVSGLSVKNNKKSMISSPTN